jgi:hypothetical protein
MQSSIMPTFPVTPAGSNGHGDIFGYMLLLLLFGERGRWGTVGTDGTGVVTPTLFLEGLSGISSSLNEMALSNQSSFADLNNSIRNTSDYLSTSMGIGFNNMGEKIGTVGDKVTAGNFAIAQELCKGFCAAEKTTLGVGASISKDLNCVDRNLSNMITNSAFANQSGFSAVTYNLQSGFDKLAGQASAYHCEQIQATKDGTNAIINKLDSMKAAEQAATIAKLEADLRDKANRDAFIEINNRQIAIGNNVNSNNSIITLLSELGGHIKDLTTFVKKS